MIGWYAPLVVFALAPHVTDIANRLWPMPQSEEPPEPLLASDGSGYIVPPGQSFRYSMIALLFIWIAAALSPLGQTVLGRGRPPAQLYGRETPVELTNFLRQKSPENPLSVKGWDHQVFHPQWWGDWLDRTAPAKFQPFVTTNIHLVPAQVWNDYNRILGLQSGWERTLQRYDIGAIIVDKREQGPLLRTLQRHSDWRLTYEDEQAALFVLEQGRADGAREAQSVEAPAEDAT
jgi:hypothetical protein